MATNLNDRLHALVDAHGFAAVLHELVGFAEGAAASTAPRVANQYESLADVLKPAESIARRYDLR